MPVWVNESKDRATAEILRAEAKAMAGKLRAGFSCYFPIVTMIILSVVLTVLLNIIIRSLNK